MRFYISSFVLLFLLTSCQSKKENFTAQEIVDQSIEASNLSLVANAVLKFDFRDYSYRAIRNNGGFVLERIKKTDSVTVIDLINNDGFMRTVGGLPYAVPDTMAIKYSESVNSVHYFSVLPYGLNDGAVNKKRLEDITIKGKDYFKIEVTFDQEGGGVDFEDVFVYWINKENFKVDYLAYLFHVNGGGTRFRAVSKEHNVESIRLADYDNYKPNDSSIDVRAMDQAFEKGELTKVSEINLENVQVELFPN
jgi:hypothetical protein